MRCDYCDEPAVMHMTNLHPGTGQKTEVHACLRHAGNAGLPPAAVQAMARQMEASRQAIDALQAFVASARRAPSADEIRAMPALSPLLPADPTDPLLPLTVERLGAMARLMLEEPSPRPPP